MDCCSQEHTFVPRHSMWSSTLAPVGAMLAGDDGPRGSTSAARTAEGASAALEVLRKSISVDVYSHGGKAGITSKAPPNDDLANTMRAGSLAIACLADVPDGPILGRDALRQDPPLRNAYSSLKEDLARKHQSDRNAYSNAKTEFVQSVLEAAGIGLSSRTAV